MICSTESAMYERENAKIFLYPEKEKTRSSCEFLIKINYLMILKKIVNLHPSRSGVYAFSSYHIRSPLDLQLFRSVESVQEVKQSLKARYRDESIATEIQQLLEKHKASNLMSKQYRLILIGTTQQEY